MMNYLASIQERPSEAEALQMAHDAVRIFLNTNQVKFKFSKIAAHDRSSEGSPLPIKIAPVSIETSLFDFMDAVAELQRRFMEEWQNENARYFRAMVESQKMKPYGTIGSRR